MNAKIHARLRPQAAGGEAVPVRANIKPRHIAEEIDRVVGFELGADDYVMKPFSPRELVLRVKSVAERVADHLVPAQLVAAGGRKQLLVGHRVDDAVGQPRGDLERGQGADDDPLGAVKGTPRGLPEVDRDQPERDEHEHGGDEPRPEGASRSRGGALTAPDGSVQHREPCCALPRHGT